MEKEKWPNLDLVHELSHFPGRIAASNLPTFCSCLRDNRALMYFDYVLWGNNHGWSQKGQTLQLHQVVQEYHPYQVDQTDLNSKNAPLTRQFSMPNSYSDIF